jgi:hypothetical protein
MNRRHRILVFVVAGLLLLASGSVCAYVYMHRMAPVESYDRGSASLPHHVLIAMQGSVFKDRLVSTLVAQLEKKPVHVRVIDIAGLKGLDADPWQVIVIVHTWEIGKPPRTVSDFIAKHAQAVNIVDVTTSGSGRDMFRASTYSARHR